MRKHLFITLAAATLAMSGLIASSAYAAQPPLPPDIRTPVEFGQATVDLTAPPASGPLSSASSPAQSSQPATKGKPVLLLAVSPKCQTCDTVQALIMQEAPKYPDLQIQVIDASAQTKLPASDLPAVVVIVPDVSSDPVYAGKVEIQTAAQADAFLEKRQSVANTEAGLARQIQQESDRVEAATAPFAQEYNTIKQQATAALGDLPERINHAGTAEERALLEAEATKIVAPYKAQLSALQDKVKASLGPWPDIDGVIQDQLTAIIDLDNAN